MKKIALLCVGGTLVLMASSVRAQDATGAVPSLADVMSSMSSEEVTQMESDVSSGGSLSMDMDVTIEAAVSDAVSEGLISVSKQKMPQRHWKSCHLTQNFSTLTFWKLSVT